MVFSLLVSQPLGYTRPTLFWSGFNFYRKNDTSTADALNRVIQTLSITASKDAGIYRYYQIGAIGYGGSRVESAFTDLFPGQDLIWIDDLYNKPLRIEDRMKTESDGAGGYIKIPTKFFQWIDSVAGGPTPMCEAVEKTKSILERWIQDHPDAYPPTVINLTDGESTDGDPRPFAESLKALKTSDGNVILMTIHASSNEFSKQVFFPSTSEELPDLPSRIMFEVSSPITDSMIRTAEELLQTKLNSGAKGLVYNAGIEGIVSALEIGTRPANLR